MKRLTYDCTLGGGHCYQIRGADNLLCKEVCAERTDNRGCDGCPIADAFDRLAAYEDTGLEPEEIKYRLDAVTAAVDAALSVINEFAAEMDYCVYSCIYQAVAAIGEGSEANHG